MRRANPLQINVLLSTFFYEKSTASQKIAGLFGNQKEIQLANKKIEIYNRFIADLKLAASNPDFTQDQLNELVERAASEAFEARKKCATEGVLYYDRHITYYKSPGSFEAAFIKALKKANMKVPSCLNAADSRFYESKDSEKLLQQLRILSLNVDIRC